MKVKGNHPLAEVIAKCMFGIETIPKEYIRRSVNKAAKEAVEWYEKNKVVFEPRNPDNFDLPKAILELMRQKSQQKHEYINPNFLSDLSGLLWEYFEIENDDVDKWIKDMYGA